MKQALLLLVILASVAGKQTVRDRVEQYTSEVNRRLSPAFRAARVSYPPKQLVLVGLKQERALEVYAAGEDGKFKLIKSYRILAASGKLGPKLREGDNQVPEGIYEIESLNPNSLYHLSLRISYPSKFDRTQAKQDGRKDLGGDIMIHGGAASIGCIAVGDEAAEELFVLAEVTGLKNIVVILSAVDFRMRKLPADYTPPQPWVQTLYRDIAASLKNLSKLNGDH